MAKDAALVRRFFESGGIPAKAVEIQGVEATDLLTQTYRQGAPASRYIVAQTLMVRTDDVDRIAALAQRVGEIVEAGVVLSAEGAPQGPFYLFTRLNDIKPQMIAEATRNARAAPSNSRPIRAHRSAPYGKPRKGSFRFCPGMPPRDNRKRNRS
jgi:hypothetical protein